MAALNRRLEVIARSWSVVDDALTIAEREADCRLVLRAVRDECERQGGNDPCLPNIMQILDAEGDSPELGEADERLLDGWAHRHGFTAAEIARNRASRPTRTRVWLEKLRQGVSPRLEYHARDFWGALEW